MYRIDNASAAGSLPTPAAAGTGGYWTNGNPGLGLAPTIIDADWLNTVQEELIHIVSVGGGTPTKGTNTQVLTALSALFGVQRIRLTGALTLYVAATGGSDSNNGLTSGAPFATISHALQVLGFNYDLNNQVATIQLADGTYNAGCSLGLTFVGGQLGSVIIQGDVGTPANVLVSVGGTNAFYFARGAQVTFQYMKLTITSGNWGCFVCDQGATVQVGAGIEFGATSGVHVSAINGGRVIFSNNYKISGGGLAHWAADYGSFISCVGNTVTITGTPAFTSAFATAADASQMNVNGNTFSGPATGLHFVSQTNAIINTGGGGSSYLPGGTTGTTATGGLYV